METLEIAVDIKATLGEGPCWHQDRLYWIDIIEGKVHIHDPIKKSNQVFDVGEMIGTIAPRASGGMMISLANAFAFFDEKTGQIDKFCPIEHDQPENRFNDGKCSPEGRFWCGSMEHAEATPKGTLYVLNSDHSFRPMRQDVMVSNGMAWTQDGKTMYYTDSGTKRVDAYDYHPETGELSNMRTVIRLGEEDGFPDGLTIDKEGMIWLAQWGAWCVCRYNPATGERLQKIDVPAAHTSACTFGGEDMSTLYITTARARISESELQGPQNKAGSLFSFKTDTQGFPAHTFAG
jgi:sugar lactone lactonase YvrE